MLQQSGQRNLKPLYTVGYEGRKPEELFRMLTEAGVETLVDVRELPLSRRKGFSKMALSASSARFGITYLHMRELGTPRQVRHQLKSDGDYVRFRHEYHVHLAGQRDALARLYEHITDRVCCLLCFEGHAENCHRSLLADEVKSLNGQNVTIRHL